MRALVIVAILLGVCAAFMAGSSQAFQCGKQANNKKCPDNICCSRWGWCGTSDAYCGSGCQSDCLQCGRKRGGLKCRSGRCCSFWGYCGSSPAYCCSGCQSNCNCAAGSLVDEILGLDFYNTTNSLTQASLSLLETVVE